MILSIIYKVNFDLVYKFIIAFNSMFFVNLVTPNL